MRELLLGVLLLLAIAWLVVRIRAGRKDASGAQRTPSEAARDTRFHAVSIKYSESGCAAAKAMTGRRFLATAAPRLPLPECDALECRCQFTHHDDRRSGRDRRSPFAARGYGAGGSGSFEKERRQRADRRRSEP